MKPDDKNKEHEEELLKRHKPLEFHKIKPETQKSKEHKKEANPSPNAPLVPCIRCGKTHRKGAKCQP
ncbi:hypothetical protein [Candidatus Berkiella aquae]|uniref:Uncharacterized protein n=1 Tax=Candidatus Berkiella aquae TaxID=295108 RepID=A0A0Q9YR68_9GAMM|nr:hypothetical protein [Candidatus Berkiella aquae]MCS5709917.1 hypothetical protein [Candidatus Berkiella aquae]